MAGKRLEYPVSGGRGSHHHGTAARDQILFTLHDTDGTRLLGFDNAHGVPRALAFDHRHRFRRTQELVPYNFVGADELICDFFAGVEQACRQEGVAFDFVDQDIELEDDDETDESV